VCVCVCVCVYMHCRLGLTRQFLFVWSVDNTQVVHHMILYRVPAPVRVGQAPWSCSSMPSGASPMWVWAVGCVRHAQPQPQIVLDCSILT
jgi:hypothetical protein